MGYCIFRNISLKTTALWITIFCELFRKIQFAIFRHTNRSEDFTHISHSIDFTHV